jgi:membrane-associated phospholipid phosphatase
LSEFVSNVSSADAQEATGSVREEQKSDDLAVLRISDLFAISVPMLFGLVLLSNADRVIDGYAEAAALIGAAIFSFACRAWATRSKHLLAQITGNFYVMVPLWVLYSRLNPLIDLLSPVPYDRDLQALDHFLFGMQPSVWMERFHHPWLTELLFWCYTAFFFWQLALGVVLFARKEKSAFNDYILTVLVFYILSDVMYVLVPAIGPRFALADQYSVPLQGVWYAETLRHTFAVNPMLRDCFPSGHTGLTLLVMFHALHKRAHLFFAVMLPFGLLLIVSTVYCRFHYVIDLVCAIPFTTGIYMLQTYLRRALPEGLAIPVPRRARSRVEVLD